MNSITERLALEFNINAQTTSKNFNLLKKTLSKKHKYIDNNILNIYEYALFYKFNKLTMSKNKFCKMYSLKIKMFNIAYNEIQVEDKKEEKKDEDIVVNLYSIKLKY